MPQKWYKRIICLHLSCWCIVGHSWRRTLADANGSLAHGASSALRRSTTQQLSAVRAPGGCQGSLSVPAGVCPWGLCPPIPCSPPPFPSSGVRVRVCVCHTLRALSRCAQLLGAVWLHVAPPAPPARFSAQQTL